MDIELRSGERSPGTAPVGGAPSVPGYVLLEELGRGGCAIVYEARQDAFGRTVALKVLTRLLDDGLARRFERERRAIGALSSHPNIVTVHDAGLTATGEPYIAMELMDGGSLADRLRIRGPLPHHEVVTIGAAIADGLAAAHRAGLLHRDVKPGNVLVDHLGVAKLSDFGIAAFQQEPGSVTGGMAGTVAYTAPEVLSGRPASVASDVYSLGATLYTLLAGDAPFVRDTDESFLASALRAWTEPAPDLRERGVPDALAALVEATMAKEPQDRPASAAIVAAALRECARTTGPALHTRPLDGAGTVVLSVPPTWAVAASPAAPVEPAPAEAPEDERGPRSRFARAAQIAAAVGVFAAAGTVATLLVLDATGAEPDRAPGAPAATPSTAPSSAPSAGPSATAAPTGRVTPEPTVTTQPTPTRERFDLGPRVVASVPVGNAVGVDHGDDTVWVTVIDPPSLVGVDMATRTVRHRVALPSAPEGLAVGADGVWAADFETGIVWRVDPADGRIVAEIPVGNGPTDLTITEDGVWVTLLSDTAVVRIDPATNRVAQTVRLTDLVTVIQAHGGRLWVASIDGRVRPVSGDGRIGAPLDLPGPATAVAAGFDAIWVAARIDGAQGQVLRIDPATGEITATLTVGNNPNGLAVGAGAVWVTGTDDDVVWRIDPGRGDGADRPRARGTVDVVGTPLGISASDDAVWVAVVEGGALQVIEP
jgi:sugar lactone lactonase YvrE